MRRYKTVSFLFRLFLKQSRFVLDLGCGVGEYLKYAIGKNRTVIGVDLDKSLLQNRLFNFTPLQGDAQNLAFKDEIFDLVLFSEVLEHLPHPEKALNEIKRILKPNGILIISTPSKKSLYEKQHLVFVIYLFIRIFQRLTGRKAPDKFHISLQSPNDLKHMLRKRKLKILSEHYTGFCLPFTGELLNFLFKFTLITKLYKKIDVYVNKSETLASLNWTIIFICKKFKES